MRAGELRHARDRRSTRQTLRAFAGEHISHRLAGANTFTLRAGAGDDRDLAGQALPILNGLRHVRPLASVRSGGSIVTWSLLSRPGSLHPPTLKLTGISTTRNLLAVERRGRRSCASTSWKRPPTAVIAFDADSAFARSRSAGPTIGGSSRAPIHAPDVH